MATGFNNLIIKSNPQAAEIIEKMLSKGTKSSLSNSAITNLNSSKSKIKQAMKRSDPPSDKRGRAPEPISKKSHESDEGRQPPTKKQETSPHKGSSGGGDKGDPPKPPEKPTNPEESKVDNTELIKRCTLNYAPTTEKDNCKSLKPPTAPVFSHRKSIS